jgi:hypothetical protein
MEVSMKTVIEFLVIDVWLLLSEASTSERGQEIKSKIINYRAIKMRSLETAKHPFKFSTIIIHYNCYR